MVSPTPHPPLLQHRLRRCQTTISAILAATHDKFFKDEGPEIQQQWYQYGETIDQMIYEALVTTIKKSMMEFKLHIIGDGLRCTAPSCGARGRRRRERNGGGGGGG